MSSQKNSGWSRKQRGLLCEREVKPVAQRLDREAIYPAELVKSLGELGLMGIFVPQEFGGSGMDLLSYVVAMEEISKAWASLAVDHECAELARLRAHSSLR